ncbi:MAG TPA: macro domain-containing protein, partial [Dokdonella sp.]
LLAACYRNVLDIAHAQSLHSIAFPAISCGVFGYPVDKAAAIALGEIARAEHAALDITICCRGERVLESYRAAAVALGITILT